MLAVARAAGETAPLLFTALFSDYWLTRNLMEPTPSLAVLIYNFSELAVPQPDRDRLGGLAGPGGPGADRQHRRPRSTRPRRTADKRAPMSTPTGDRAVGRLTANPARSRHGQRRRRRRSSTSTCRSLYYGDFKAVRDTPLHDQEEHHHRVHRPVRLRQEHGAAQHQPHERPDARLPLRGPDPLPRQGRLRPRASIPVAVRRHIGMVFQQPNPFAMSIYQQRRVRPAAQRLQAAT